MFSYYLTAHKDKYSGFAALLLTAFLLAACTTGSHTAPPPQNPDNRLKPDSVAYFSTPANGDKSGRATAQAMSQAAAITLQRHYKYFLLIADNKKDKTTMRPSFGFSYGRQPYGFGDAGSAGPGLGFSVAPAFFSRAKAAPKQTEWAVYMMRQADRQALDALPLDKAALGKTAYIYNARDIARLGDSEPIILPLR